MNKRDNKLLAFISQSTTLLLTRLALTTLRLLFLSLSMCLLLSSMFMPAGPAIVSGQSGQTDQITQVKNSLLIAFEAVQTSEQKGASNQSLAPLIIELNQALAYEMIAEEGNSTAALQSISLSNDVSMRAEAIGNHAQTETENRTIFAYLAAIALAFGSSIVVLEADRVRRLFEKRRLIGSRIEQGETSNIA